ncbi:hypothetical protein EJ05DRAFT_496128 [Pseudovirgaria hyperparasitica]|uniref:Uncharacterized protein n=1 Tax=Pseudovirgaria hyperparasitica TaxID=470096 RepID=A0A6A6WM68_9PEZI|nr:uncharacterized protein EJ05DRAFT_496128 [Pseudovirgaria hyperparasitica]KAF2763301.1 hypothetical protein EJ05DRAFT_496128 [Pseudovirgaria hyperparasitica]
MRPSTPSLTLTLALALTLLITTLSAALPLYMAPVNARPRALGIVDQSTIARDGVFFADAQGNDNDKDKNNNAQVVGRTGEVDWRAWRPREVLARLNLLG